MRIRNLGAAVALVAAAGGVSACSSGSVQQRPPLKASPTTASSVPATSTTVVDRMAAFCVALQAVANDLKVESNASTAQRDADAQALHSTSVDVGGQVQATTAKLGADSRASSAGDGNSTIAALHDLAQLRHDCAGAGHPIS